MRKPMTRGQMRARYKNGHGVGDGKAYLPWLDVRSFGNRGKTHRQVGRLTGRHHLLLSDHELWTFLALQRRDDVVDMREQYPLWPLEETEGIAASMGVAHPGAGASNPTVMTTDLLLTLRGGGLEAVAVKPTDELELPRTIEKLEIERSYWAARDVPWWLVTEREITPDMGFNLVFIDDCHELREDDAGGHGIDAVEAELFKRLRDRPDDRLDEACLACDAAFSLRQGVSLNIARRALARKHWSVPLAVRIDPAAPLRSLRPGPAFPTRDAEAGKAREASGSAAARETDTPTKRARRRAA